LKNVSGVITPDPRKIAEGGHGDGKERKRGRGGREGRGSEGKERRGGKGMVPPRFNLMPHRFPCASYRPRGDQSFRDQAEPSRNLKILETDTCEKRVSRSLEPRLEFRGLYITGHNHRQLSKVAVRLATYPTITAMLQIFVTLGLPVTTEPGRKSFSALKHLKIYLRSTMTEDHLNGLAHLYINRGIALARPLKSLEGVTDA
jgi:hypothetical protein